MKIADHLIRKVMSFVRKLEMQASLVSLIIDFSSSYIRDLMYFIGIMQ